MSTRACYRFIEPTDGCFPSAAPVVTVYKHSDGYPSGAAQWIEAALEYAWPLPRFEADDFAAAFVAANKSLITYYERLARKATDPHKKQQLLEHAEEYRTGRYKGYNGGNVRLVPYEGMNAHARFASDTEYLYDITTKKGKLHVTAHAIDWKAETEPVLTTIFEGSLAQMKRWAKTYKG